MDLTETVGTGEHGVGVGKKEYLTEELGENTIELMRTVKEAIDPLGIMNPGKVSFMSFVHRNSILCLCIGDSELRLVGFRLVVPRCDGVGW